MIFLIEFLYFFVMAKFLYKQVDVVIPLTKTFVIFTHDRLKGVNYFTLLAGRPPRPTGTSNPMLIA